MKHINDPIHSTTFLLLCIFLVGVFSFFGSSLLWIPHGRTLGLRDAWKVVDVEYKGQITERDKNITELAKALETCKNNSRNGQVICE